MLSKAFQFSNAISVNYLMPWVLCITWKKCLHWIWREAIQSILFSTKMNYFFTLCLLRVSNLSYLNLLLLGIKKNILSEHNAIAYSLTQHVHCAIYNRTRERNDWNNWARSTAAWNWQIKFFMIFSWVHPLIQLLSKIYT